MNITELIENKKGSDVRLFLKKVGPMVKLVCSPYPESKKGLCLLKLEKSKAMLSRRRKVADLKMVLYERLCFSFSLKKRVL